MENETEKWLSAIHEAGHVVIAYMLGIKIRKVVLKTNRPKRSYGYISVITKSEYDDTWLKKMIAVSLAGKTAETALTSRKHKWNVDPDVRRAISYLFNLNADQQRFRDLTRSEQGKFIRQEIVSYRKRLLHYMKLPSSKRIVLSVASELIHHHSINGKEINLLLKNLGIKKHSLWCVKHHPTLIQIHF